MERFDFCFYFIRFYSNSKHSKIVDSVSVRGMLHLLVHYRTNIPAKSFEIKFFVSRQSVAFAYKWLVDLIHWCVGFGGFYKVHHSAVSFTWQTYGQNIFRILDIDWPNWPMFFHSACINFWLITMEFTQEMYLDMRRRRIYWFLRRNDKRSKLLINISTELP